MAQNRVGVLIRVRELLSDPERWCRMTRAKDSVGMPISPTDPDACQFCLLGAFDRVATRKDVAAAAAAVVASAFAALEHTVVLLGYDGVHQFNDHALTTHDDVLDALTKTIDRESGEK